jgi:DNA-binding CsgD family transcriptional regulator
LPEGARHATVIDVSEGFIRIHRVRDAARLVGEVGEIGRGTEAARRHLIDGLLGLLGCAIGGMAHDTGYGRGLKAGIAQATLAGFDRDIIEVFQAHHTQGSDINPFHRAVMRLGDGAGQVFTSTSREIVATADWDGSAWVNEYVRPAHVDHFMGSVRRVGKTACMGCGFMRAAGDQPFSEEDREVLHLVHVGVGQFFEAPSPRALLAPRVRDTLDVLVSGATDKEIAAKLGISPHTVRQYVKSILRAYGVSSRAQLIARAAPRRP